MQHGTANIISIVELYAFAILQELAVMQIKLIVVVVVVVDLGVTPATKVARLPYPVAIDYLSTFVWYSDFVTFSHIPQASNFIRLLSSCGIPEPKYCNKEN